MDRSLDGLLGGRGHYRKEGEEGERRAVPSPPQPKQALLGMFLLPALSLSQTEDSLKAHEFLLNFVQMLHL